MNDFIWFKNFAQSIRNGFRFNLTLSPFANHPQIRQRRDRHGNPFWNVRHFSGNHTTRLFSETEVQQWLDRQWDQSDQRTAREFRILQHARF